MANIWLDDNIWLDEEPKPKKKKSDYLKRMETEIKNSKARIEAAGGNPDESKNFNVLPAILEGLRRTDYAATNLLREFIPGKQGNENDKFDPISAVVRGLTGKEKTTGKELVSSLGLSKKPLFELDIMPGEKEIKVAPSPAGIAGFATEAFNPLNPINWITFGVGGTAAKGAKGLTARMVNPITGKVAGEALIPGTARVGKAFAPMTKRAKQTDLYQKLAKSFSTKYVPEDVPDEVIAKTLKGEPLEKSIREGVQETTEKVTKTTGKEAFVDVRKAREAVEQISRGEIDKVDKEVRNMFKGLNKKERQQITNAVGLRNPDQLPEKLKPYYNAAVESLEGWRKWLRGAGLLEREMEKYVPFVATGKLTAKDKQILQQQFGTGIKTFDDLNDVQEWYAKFIPNIKERTTKAVTPKEVNEVLGKKFFEEDIAEVLSTYSARAIKAKNAKDFFDATVAKYGIRLDDAKNIKSIPKGYGLFRVKVNPETGQRMFEPVTEVTEDVIALPQEFARHINEYLGVFFDDTIKGTLWDYFDKVNNIFKTMAYLWNPGHLPRDATSNMFQLWLMGLRNRDIYRYAEGIRLLKGDKFRPRNVKYTSDEIMQMARDYGLIGTEMVSAEITRGTSGLTRKLTNNKYTDIMARATRAVDDSARLAGFIDQLAKGRTPEEAAFQVKKYLFDYFELTPFERKWMKRIIPFYTWSRKNLPTQFRELLQQPRKYAYVSRWHDYISEDYGKEDAPEWIRENAGILPPGEKDKRMYILPNLPYADMATEPRDLLSMVAPAIRVPFEVTTGQKIFSGIPIEDGFKSKASYAAGQFIPLIPRLQTMLDRDNPRQMARIMSTLGVPPTYDETAVKRSATFEERDRLREIIEMLKESGKEVPTTRELEKQNKNPWLGKKSKKNIWLD